MRMLHFSLLLILAGLALLFYAVVIGEATVSLFIIFPVIYGSGPYSLLAILLLVVGIILLFFSPLWEIKYGKYGVDEEYTHTDANPYNFQGQRENKTKYGGVILIGPIPIIFGSDKNMMTISILAAILMLLGIFFLFVIYG